MRFIKMIDYYMLRHWPRYRLFRICNAIGIKPYKWQKRYVLNHDAYMPKERGSGKTTAVMLRILMIPYNNIHAWSRAGMYLMYDPDLSEDRLRWYSGEYRRLRDLCLNAGIPVLRVEIYRMIAAYERSMCKNK